MSMPFGKGASCAPAPAHPEQIRAFDELVREYADCRLIQDEIAQQVSQSEQPVPDHLRQKLADLSQELFDLTQRLAATALVLAGNGVLQRCAELAEDADLVDAGMVGPY